MDNDTEEEVVEPDFGGHADDDLLDDDLDLESPEKLPVEDDEDPYESHFS